LLLAVREVRHAADAGEDADEEGRGREVEHQRVSGRLAAAGGLVHALRGGRMLRELRRGTSRPRRELAAAVGTLAMQHIVHAIAAERALEGADHCIRRCRRQVAVAAFTVGAELEHGPPVAYSYRTSAIQLRLRRSRREAVSSPSKDAGATSRRARSTW